MSQKLGAWTTEVIPKGTRFGPVIGRHSNVDVISLALLLKLKHMWLVGDLHILRSSTSVFITDAPIGS